MGKGGRSTGAHRRLKRSGLLEGTMGNIYEGLE